MRRKGELPELLAPAGSFEALIAAVRGGADAVYVGGKSFSARAYAKNFDLEELARAVRYCHLHGVLLYVTVNTLVYDKELQALSDYALELYKIGVDAIISADLGAISEIKRRLPDFEIHASTQMSVHNTEGAIAAARLGCSRVVLARELSLENIKSVTDSCPIETEIFLHGALCVSHSGQCLFSSLVGGRSGNRGECAQPCRLPYNGGKHILSLKDLSYAERIPELIESGAASLKIEGRMKSPEYVYRVTKIYRRLLDERRRATAEEMAELAGIFSRGGFTDAYLDSKVDSKMTGMRTDEDKAEARRMSVEEFAPERVRVRAKAYFRLGEPARMVIIRGDKQAEAIGDIPAPAERAPLTDEGLRERLSKMGSTFLSLDKQDIEIELDEGINLSPASVNGLRRAAAEKFESAAREIREKSHPCEIKPASNQGKNLISASFYSSDSFDKISDGVISAIDITFLSLESVSESKRIPSGVIIPPVIPDSETEEVFRLLARAKERGVRYALVGNIGAIEIAKRFDLIPIGDFRLNITNSLTRAAYGRLGVQTLILSPELTLPMARDIGGGVIALGRIPLMLTERCFIKENFGCSSCGKAVLRDRIGAEFPMVRTFKHRNIIFNSQITYMGDKKEELRRSRISHYHFIFSTESAEEIASLVFSFKKGEPLRGAAIRRLGKR